MAAPPTIIVHDLAQTRAALAAAEAAGMPVRLQSAPGAAAFAGAAWFAELAALARAAHPRAETEMVLDCGREPGLALAAIREGIEAIRLIARRDVREKVAAIAAGRGCRLIETRRGRALDLLDVANPERAVAGFLRERRGGA